MRDLTNNKSNNNINSYINDIKLSKNIEIKNSSNFSLNDANNIINFVINQISQNNISFFIEEKLSKETSKKRWIKNSFIILLFHWNWIKYFK